MGPDLHLIARLYKVLSLSADERLALRQRISSRLLRSVHQYLLRVVAGSAAEESIRRQSDGDS